MWKRVIKMIKQSDIVIEVVDARVPFESRSKELEKIVKKLGKYLIIVLNKADLVDEGALREIQLEIERDEKIPCVYVSSRTRKGLRRLREVLKEIARKIKKDKIFVCVVGYANTGKSSLINALRGRHVAGTAPIPGWTKGEQLIKLSRRIYLIDTPGVIPLDKEKAELLGLIRADKIEDPVSVAIKLLERIIKENPNVLKEVYKLEKVPEDPEECLKEIAKRLGRIRKGGEYDLESTARKIITDWYQGRIRILLIKLF